ncbi:MAG: thiolase family protein [Candidatus Firestonebacteria bacterium]|nr:thiolase family protein [Candidatus Firestonebacteria bacterium]
MKDIVIAGGIRTPFVKAGMNFRDLTAYDICALVLKELVYMTKLDTKLIDEIIVGNVANPPEAMNIARVSALLAGLPQEIPAFTVHRNCSSGMQAITTAYEKIQAGAADLILAGGTESMSNIPFYFRKELKERFSEIMKAKSGMDKISAVFKIHPKSLSPIIGVIVGLTDPVSGLNMGQTAENLVRDFKISREAQDEFALWSHKKAIAAIKAGKFQEEILPVYIPPQYKEVIDADVGPREDTNMNALMKLKPVFDKINGTVTVGNACSVTDGACMLIVTTREKAISLGLEIMGSLKAYSYAGLDPTRMGLGPVFATQKLLIRNNNISFKDIQLIEINEAFAAQVLAVEAAFKSSDFCKKHFGIDTPIGEIDRNILNVNGGAIAFGHPVGATGARLVLTLLKEMKRRNLNLGLASLCIGGGQGAALVFERN